MAAVSHAHDAHTGSDWAERAREALAGSGYRSGGARGAVVELLSGQECCLSAQEISERLRSQGSEVGIASVYRALEALHGLGLLQRTDLGQGTALFEPVTPDGQHHHHVVCDRCGKVTPFHDEALESAIEGVGARLGHSLEAHDVVIRGDCAACAPAAAEKG
jgi:Fur family ferric uptake transcriptional regulator